MIYKYKLGFSLPNYEEKEWEGIIFAENLRQAAEKVLEAYSYDGMWSETLVSFQIDFYEESDMYEFED